MARRCLQGMIRDFWKVKGKPNLLQEIWSIKDKVNLETWEAIDAVRELGNIGAHMEQDVDRILDVTSREAKTLINLIEILFEDWYIARHDRRSRTRSVIALGEEKKAMKEQARTSVNSSERPTSG